MILDSIDLIDKIESKNANSFLKNTKFHHIGIACKSVSAEQGFFEILGFVFEREFCEKNQGVRGVFLRRGDLRIELIENLPQSQKISGFLKNGAKMYHLAFAVDCIENALCELGVAGFENLDTKAMKGAATARERERERGRAARI